jgi:hypothetical protein
VRRTENAEALWYVSPGHVELRPEPLPAVADGQVRVRALHGALSRGTERLIAAGAVPESEFDRMRAPLMAGTFPFPVKYGYAVVGLVEAGAPDLVGHRVFALHPHQNAFVVPHDAVTAVPDGIPSRRAVLAANMETALNAVWDAAPGPADRIAIVGVGVVGALVARLCAHLPGAEVTLVDIACRSALAQALEVGFARPEAAPHDCDLVVHASGTAGGLATAIDLAGDEATVLELSWYGARKVEVPLGGAFHSRRLRLISSQVGRVSPAHRARWSPRRRLEAALRLLADPTLEALLEPPIQFPELPGRLPDILAPVSGGLCQTIDYGQE